MNARAVEIGRVHRESRPNHTLINDAVVQWKLPLSAPRTATADIRIGPAQIDPGSVLPKGWRAISESIRA